MLHDVKCTNCAIFNVSRSNLHISHIMQNVYIARVTFANITPRKLPLHCRAQFCRSPLVLKFFSTKFWTKISSGPKSCEMEPKPKHMAKSGREYKVGSQGNIYLMTYHWILWLSGKTLVPPGCFNIQLQNDHYPELWSSHWDIFIVVLVIGQEDGDI